MLKRDLRRFPMLGAACRSESYYEIRAPKSRITFFQSLSLYGFEHPRVDSEFASSVVRLEAV